ncbi:Rgg/GadR/MutR family transcriptional regulator [uncultured Lactobacillus sp.]|uniref:Rgg family transcriptional regulator n=1 Tax=uncultured Lactobacillus sp. TaxID=153152 RepID=UPI002610B05F|nr:Rgg/GadR/MutR family transcriptional regulator [uncultured Lactobacillus sp.]
MKDRIYGPKFRKIRKSNHITLIKAAQGVTSKSSLSLWEKGNDNLSFNQVLTLLENNHIQSIEFIENPILPELLVMTHQINTYYLKSNISALYKYTITKQKAATNNPQSKIVFLKYCYVCNFYQDLSQDYIFSEDDKKRLTNILLQISNWHYEDIFFFGNTLGLLNSQTIHKLANRLIQYSINTNISTKRWYISVLDSLLNAISVLIRKDYNLAKKLLHQFKQLPLSDRYAFEKIYIKAFQSYIDYIETKDDTKFKAIIQTTELLDLPDLKDGFITGFKQVKQIYG